LAIFAGGGFPWLLVVFLEEECCHGLLSISNKKRIKAENI
jgi:hypothetical protein